MSYAVCLIMSHNSLISFIVQVISLPQRKSINNGSTAKSAENSKRFFSVEPLRACTSQFPAIRKTILKTGEIEKAFSLFEFFALSAVNLNLRSPRLVSPTHEAVDDPYHRRVVREDDRQILRADGALPYPP